MATLRPTLLALSLAAATLTFAACDDGNVIGTDESAGSSGQAAGGGAGAAQAGSTSSGATNGGKTGSGGVTNGGGATNNGGTAGTGGATCETGQCVRANVCLDECGGKVVYTGCCPCAAGTVESLSCNTGAGGQGGSGSSCVGMTCDAGESCVAHRTVGGVVLLPDANGCPEGRHLENQTCQNNFSYTCSSLIGCVRDSDTCRCALQTSCAYATNCKAPSTAQWLDTDAELVCEALAP